MHGGEEKKNTTKTPLSVLDICSNETGPLQAEINMQLKF